MLTFKHVSSDHWTNIIIYILIIYKKKLFILSIRNIKIFFNNINKWKALKIYLLMKII
jgi:hypothetical protein